MIHFSHPVCLILALPAWYLYRRLGRGSGLAGVIRLCLVLILAVMIAGPVGPAPQIGSTLVLLIDQSRSMPLGIAARKARLLADANSQKRTTDSLGLVAFAATPLVELYPDSGRPPETSLGRTLGVDQTNLHAAVSAALDLIPDESPGRILVVSDGQSDDSMSDELSAKLHRRGIPVYFEQFPPEDRVVPNDIVLQSVSGPNELDQGDELRLQYRIESEIDASVSLEIRRDNEVVATIPIQLGRGTFTGTWSAPCDCAGVYRYSLSVDAPGDPVAGNNRWETWVRVRGDPRVMVVNATGLDTPMAEMLRAGNLPVDVLAAGKADGSLEKLSAYAACVLEDVALRDLASFSTQGLIAFVQRLGGGIMITGGERSFGTGGYRSSALDPLLPVALRPLNVSERPPQALVILVDPAAWDAQNHDTQLSPLQQALLSLAAEMDPADRVGIVTTRSSESVALPLTIAGKKDVRETIAQLGFSSDPTTFPRALNAAWDMLCDAPQVAKHLLVLIEGNQLLSWPPPQLDPLVSRPIAGATVSILTWGSSDAATLQQLRGRLPSGRVIPTTDVQELAGALRLDWELATGGSFVSRGTALQPMIESLSGRPSDTVQSLGVIDGFHTATLRDHGTAIVSAKDNSTQPLIARGERGLGRVCTVLFQVQSPREDSVEDAAIASLLVDQVRWMMRADERDASVKPVSELSEKTATVRLSVPGGDAAPLPGHDELQLEVTRADGAAAGTFSFEADRSNSVARFRLDGLQSYLASVRNTDRVVARCSPVVLPRSTEFLKQEAGSGRASLARLAQESGGGEWLAGTAFFGGSTAETRSLVPAFALCALLLLVLDVADRRYQIAGRVQTRWQRRRAGRRARSEERETPKELGCDPFEVAKERMRRRVQR